jgi:hypothetical protein
MFTVLNNAICLCYVFNARNVQMLPSVGARSVNRAHIGSSAVSGKKPVLQDLSHRAMPDAFCGNVVLFISQRKYVIIL